MTPTSNQSTYSISNHTIINGALVIAGAAVNLYYSWPQNNESILNMRTARIALGSLTSLAFLGLNDIEHNSTQQVVLNNNRSQSRTVVPTGNNLQTSRITPEAISRLTGSTLNPATVAAIPTPIALDNSRGITEYANRNLTIGFPEPFDMHSDLTHMIEDQMKTNNDRFSDDLETRLRALRPTELERLAGHSLTPGRNVDDRSSSSERYREQKDAAKD